MSGTSHSKSSSWSDLEKKPSQDWITKDDVLRLETNKFSDDYTLKKRLGAGAFAEVYLCTHKESGEVRAVKRVDRTFLSDEDEHNLFSEILLMRRLKNPYVIQLFEVYRDDTYYWLVQELATGGELFDRVAKKGMASECESACAAMVKAPNSEEFYTEADARAVSRTLLTGVGIMHAHGIVHRDLKPENILLMSQDSDTDIKLCDFGFAKHLTLGNQSASDVAGTLAYLAPEILEGLPYGNKVDVFSLGIIVFILLAGYNPFQGKDNKDTKRKIMEVEYEFVPEWWSGVSESAKDIVRHMLVKDPDERPSCEQLLAHDWFTQCDDDLCHNMGRVVQELRQYQARRRLKAGMQTVASMNRMRRLSSMLKLAAERSRQEGTMSAGSSTMSAAPSVDSISEAAEEHAET